MKMKALSTLILSIILLSGCVTEEETARPDVPEARLETISEALLMGDPEKAVAAHEQAFKNAPNEPGTRVLYARLLILTQRLDEAKKEIAAVLAKEPGNLDALYAQSLVAGLEGDKKTQQSLLEKTVAAKDAPAEAVASLGSLYLEEKNYPKAKELFSRAQAQDAENFVAVIGLGSVNFKEKNFKEAKKHFDRAVALQPDYPFAYSDRALVKRYLGDLDGALEDLNTAVKLEPDYSYNYFDRGRVLMDKGRWDEAIAQYTAAIEKEPDMFAAFVMRAGLYDDMGKYDEALRDYEMVLKLRPDYYFAYSLAGSIYLMQDAPAKASPMFEKAFEYEKGTSEYALLAALSLKKAGNNKGAAAYLNKAVVHFKRPSWQYDMAQFYLLPESDNLAVSNANREKNKAVRAQMLFYLAEQYLLLDKKSLARTYFSETAGLERRGMIEKKLAQFELGRLAGK